MALDAYERTTPYQSDDFNIKMKNHGVKKTKMRTTNIEIDIVNAHLIILALWSVISSVSREKDSQIDQVCATTQAIRDASTQIVIIEISGKT